MRRHRVSGFSPRLIALLGSLALALAACSSSKSNPPPGADATVSNGTDTGSPGGLDGSTNPGSDGSTPGADASAPGDSGPPDTGTQGACVRDQDCPSGQVCNLNPAMGAPLCVPGVACPNGDADCANCGALQNPKDCKHGYHLQSYCDANHGSVCVRSLAPCEPCTADQECGTLPFGARTAGKCLEYGGPPAGHFCGRAADFGCPAGFVRDPLTSQCRRESGCPASVTLCPAKTGTACPGHEQICSGQACSNDPGARCSTDDQPGALGICIPYCTDNSQCPHDLPFCDQHNGVCIAGCSKGACAAGQVCQANGLCGAPCNDNAYCMQNYGMNTYCNLPGGMAPDYHKSYRDDNACAPLGCEQSTDCGQIGMVCDKTQNPPSCVAGCYTDQPPNSDCMAGEVCKSLGGMPRMDMYSRAQCRALPMKTDPNEIGVCCSVGCTSRVLNCNLNQFCCGETNSPYANTNSCPMGVTPGDCFDIAPPPWCKACDPTMPPAMQCNSGWMFGFDTDPAVNNGMPFQEQEFCQPIGMVNNMPKAYCSVTCNPGGMDDGCPRGWQCAGTFVPCMMDADCNGMNLVCVGASTTAMTPGRCQCGFGGHSTATCPTMYPATLGAAPNARCAPEVRGGTGNMFCLVSYDCLPPPASPASPYPAGCQ
jgi:hypothetical protein